MSHPHPNLATFTPQQIIQHARRDILIANHIKTTRNANKRDIEVFYNWMATAAQAATLGNVPMRLFCAQLRLAIEQKPVVLEGRFPSDLASLDLRVIEYAKEVHVMYSFKYITSNASRHDYFPVVSTHDRNPVVQFLAKFDNIERLVIDFSDVQNPCTTYNGISQTVDIPYGRITATLACAAAGFAPSGAQLHQHNSQFSKVTIKIGHGEAIRQVGGAFNMPGWLPNSNGCDIGTGCPDYHSLTKYFGGHYVPTHKPDVGVFATTPFVAQRVYNIRGRAPHSFQKHEFKLLGYRG